MGWFDDIFGGGQGQEYKDIQNGLNQGKNDISQYYDKARGYLNPYYQAGVNSLGQYQNALTSMSNPQAYYNQVMSGYQESPAAKFRIAQGTNAANARAAATGLSGSSNNLDDVSNITQGLVGQDQQQYFDNINGIHRNYLQALLGLEGQGYGAGAQMGQWSAGEGDELGNYDSEIGAAQGQQAVAHSNALNHLLQGIGSAFGLGGGSPSSFGGNLAPVSDASSSFSVPYEAALSWMTPYI